MNQWNMYVCENKIIGIGILRLFIIFLCFTTHMHHRLFPLENPNVFFFHSPQTQHPNFLKNLYNPFKYWQVNLCVISPTLHLQFLFIEMSHWEACAVFDCLSQSTFSTWIHSTLHFVIHMYITKHWNLN